MNITTRVYLDKRHPKRKADEDAPDIYPIKLMITKDRKQRYYAIPNTKTNGITFEATADEYIKINGTGARGKLRDIKILIPKILEEADEIIIKMKEFDFDLFRDLFYKKDQSKRLFDVFDEYITELKKQDKISTAQSYQCALNSFKEFDPKLDFVKVDKDRLKAYETWYLNKTVGKNVKRSPSITTVGIYTRCLRAIFNYAIEKGVTENYPFGKGKFTPPSGNNIKKAINLEQIKKIIDYKAVSLSPMDRSRDLWVFSYFSNGMNMKDICSIKEADVKGDLETIEFVREKTKNSSRGKSKKIEIIIVPETKEIIEKWCVFKNDPKNYIFPCFEKNDTELQKRTKIIQLVKTTNKYLKGLSQELSLSEEIKTYHARHSFASTLKESGAPIEFISEALGHSSMQTTESYLKSFSRKHKEKWAKVLRGKKQDSQNE